MKIKGWIEISKKDYEKLKIHEGAAFYDYETREIFYFKKEEVWPRVFEDDSYLIEVNKQGNLIIWFEDKDSWFNQNQSFPLLKQAVDFADKIRSKK